MGQVAHRGVVLLVAGHHAVQQGIEFVRANGGGVIDGLFDVLQVDPQGAESTDILHGDLVELAGYLEPAAYLLQQRQLQTPEQLRQLLRESVENGGAKKGTSPYHLLYKKSPLPQSR